MTTLTDPPHTALLVIHTDLHRQWQSAPGRTAGTADSGKVEFTA